MPAAVESGFVEWSREWLAEAEFCGATMPGEDERIDRILKLWHGHVPGEWKRKQYPPRLRTPDRYCRDNADKEGERRGEHRIEDAVLGIGKEEAICLGARLVDGVNAVPLTRDVGGGRAGNVEADMLLLVRDGNGYRQLLIEVKVQSDDAWYAAVENLRQLKLFRESRSAQRLFHERNPGLSLPSELPVTALTLAPASFYSAHGKKRKSVAPAQKLLHRLREKGADAWLATWDPEAGIEKLLRRDASGAVRPNAPALDGNAKTPASVAAASRRAPGDALERARPGVERDQHGYAVQLEDNLLPEIKLDQIAAEFGAGAGKELEGKMRAPWSSSALAVNAFAPWGAHAGKLALAGLSGFTAALKFEAQCPNGVSKIPPHLDVLLERGDEIVGVESKCIEFLSAKKAKVADAYKKLAEVGDDRAKSRWFAALNTVPAFRLLDVYQLVKHYLGLARTFPNSPLALVYVYWEPKNADSLAPFVDHSEEVEQFASLVAGDATCRFIALSYPEHWQELGQLPQAPPFLATHLEHLRRRYLITV